MPKFITKIDGRRRHAWRGPGLALLAAAVSLSGCGGDGKESPATGAILIKAHADLQSIIDRGEVLDGSSFHGEQFCAGGTFTGEHGSTAMINRKFKCPEGTLTVGFTPDGLKGRTATARWKVLRGTQSFEDATGGGRMQTVFARGSQPSDARETYTGNITR